MQPNWRLADEIIMEEENFIGLDRGLLTAEIIQILLKLQYSNSHSKYLTKNWYFQQKIYLFKKFKIGWGINYPFLRYLPVIYEIKRTR